jgi:DNA-binding CsgD family transcriptional regulator
MTKKAMTHEAIDTAGHMYEQPHALRTALQARDPARLGALLAGLATQGIVADAEADVLVVDLADAEPAPEDTRPLLLLTDDLLFHRDQLIAGVLPRAATDRQVAAALHAIAAGLTVRAGLAESGFAALDDVTEDRPGPSLREDAGPIMLTPREMEILASVGEGLSNKAVARRLGISAHTVKFHLEAVFGKLQARTRAEAVAKGLRRGLIEV